MLGAELIATGHYVRREDRDGHTYLLKGRDPNKDQSYFLCQLKQEQLAKALFPVGELLKPEVRAIAKEIGLVTADKKDSQGLCFVGKVHLPDFLQQQLKPKKGKAIEVAASASVFSKADRDDLEYLSVPYDLSPSIGKEIGEHNGAHYYTIGQRKGLNIGGQPRPLFVIGTDTKENIIYMGLGEDHPGLYRKGLFIPLGDEHWIRTDLKLNAGQTATFKARIRYRQPLESCTLHKKDEGLYIIFDKPQRGVTPGQFAAWYDGDELIGSGVIS